MNTFIPKNHMPQNDTPGQTSPLPEWRSIFGNCPLAWYVLLFGDEGCDDLAELIHQGLQVRQDDYPALLACVEGGCPKTGEMLIDQGINYGEFEQWAMAQWHGLAVNDTQKELAEYWNTRLDSELVNEPSM